MAFPRFTVEGERKGGWGGGWLPGENGYSFALIYSCQHLLVRARFGVSTRRETEFAVRAGAQGQLSPRGHSISNTLLSPPRPSGGRVGYANKPLPVWLAHMVTSPLYIYITPNLNMGCRPSGTTCQPFRSGSPRPSAGEAEQRKQSEEERRMHRGLLGGRQPTDFGERRMSQPKGLGNPKPMPLSGDFSQNHACISTTSRGCQAVSRVFARIFVTPD